MDCHGQEEAEAIALCREHLSKEAAKDVFVLTYDRMRRYEGAWHMEKALLFPSYILVDSGEEGILTGEMGKKSRGLIPVDRETENFLKFLYGDCHHLKMSKGIIRDGIAQVIAGPLKGLEQKISRIDRHKRIAELAVPMGHSIMAGLEITEKRMGPVFPKST